MIKCVKLTRFKKYKEQSFTLKPKGVSLLVGGNNAGKSTLIHALAVWEFCKMILLHEKGRTTFDQNQVGKGEGVRYECGRISSNCGAFAKSPMDKSENTIISFRKKRMARCLSRIYHANKMRLGLRRAIR